VANVPIDERIDEGAVTSVNQLSLADDDLKSTVSQAHSQFSAITNCTNATFANVHRVWK